MDTINVIVKRKGITPGENADQTAAGNESKIKKKQDADAPRDNTRVEQAEARTEQAEARTEQAVARTEQAVGRTEQAVARTEQAEARTEQAEARTEQAEARAEQAEARTEQAEARSEQAEARSEQAIRASELSYRRLFEAAKDGILILDADTGRISDVNPFLVELLGFSLTAKWSAKPSANLVRSRTSSLIKPCWSGYNSTGMFAMKTCHLKRRITAELPWSLSATFIRLVTKK